MALLPADGANTTDLPKPVTRRKKNKGGMRDRDNGSSMVGIELEGLVLQIEISLYT